MSVSAGSDSSTLRVSDHEREQHIDILRRHAADGRLTVDELEERVERAYAARTREQLAGVLAQLPALAEASAAPPRPVADSRRRLVTGDLAPYVGVNLLLIAIWALTGGGFFWPIWAILGWGVGIVSHARAGSSALIPCCRSGTATRVPTPGG